VGTHKGEFCAKFCAVGLTMFAVDPWLPFTGQGRTQMVKETQDGYLEEAKKNLSPYPDCTMVRKSSMDAINDFKDGSLDFVYLDGDHSFRYVAEDIVEWTKKVRKGGVVSGHDYFNTAPLAKNVMCHVKAVVDAYTKYYEIKDWYLVGDKRSDKAPSWMFIKL
jgi:hypothetical protein